MNHHEWRVISNDYLRRLVDDNLSKILVMNHPLADELRDLENGQLWTRISEYRRNGRRKYERREIEPTLAKHSVSRTDIAQSLGINVSSVSRWLNGQTESDKLENIYVEYRDELHDIQQTFNASESDIAGYCHAMECYRADLFAVLKLDVPSKPPISAENFCYLWVALRDKTYQAALAEDEPNLKETRLEAAISRIYDSVKDSAFPSYRLATRKSSETIESIHRRWGLWFRLVVFCGPDVLNFHQDTSDTFDYE